jgi:hypothetical protein
MVNIHCHICNDTISALRVCVHCGNYICTRHYEPEVLNVNPITYAHRCTDVQACQKAMAIKKAEQECITVFVVTNEDDRSLLTFTDSWDTAIEAAGISGDTTEIRVPKEKYKRICTNMLNALLREEPTPEQVQTPPEKIPGNTITFDEAFRHVNPPPSESLEALGDAAKRIKESVSEMLKTVLHIMLTEPAQEKQEERNQDKPRD